MASKSSETSQDVPIFLRKTYHMIDTCNPAIACWSDDGETFVVKDPVKFEQTIIPQFFKHSKFSSFVRQLNFYSFRKIKYVDTIRIDPKLEKETANYWRFRHENFRRGHPELLTEIKRMNGQKAPSTLKPGEKIDVDKSTNREVQVLKKRIDEMHKNIDQLTAMVQKVSLKQDGHSIPLEYDDVPLGSKRVKLDPSDDIVRPDEMLSTMEFEEMDVPDVPISMPSPLVSRETSDTTITTDNEFVDELFNAFNEDQDDVFVMEEAPPEPTSTKTEAFTQTTPEDSSRPDPILMNRLADALALLPQDIQVLIVDRLIAAIMSTDSLVNTSLLAAAIEDVDPKKVAAGGKAFATPEMSQMGGDPAQAAPFVAATLAALLHHYAGTQVKGKNPKNVQKSIPVIPVHA
jgi:hypothetical protein